MAIALTAPKQNSSSIQEALAALGMNGADSQIEVKMEIYLNRNKKVVIQRIIATFVAPRSAIFWLRPLPTERGDLSWLCASLSENEELFWRIICINKLVGYRHEERNTSWPATVLGFYGFSTNSHLALL